MKNMSKQLLSQNLNILKSLIGTRIVSVSRYLLKSDFHVDDFQQNADGPVEITFDNGTIIYFNSFTSGESISMFEGKMPLYGESYVYKDVSNNLFWSSRIRQKITKMYVLKSEYFSTDFPLECVLEIFFENNTKACVEYLSDEDFIDTLRVTSKFNESHLLRIEVL